MARRGEITGKKPRVTADRAKRHKIPRTNSPIVETDADAVEPGENECTSTPPVPPAVYSIATFCVAHDISEAFYFKLKNQNLGPQEIQLGRRRIISLESARAWRKAREAATAEEAVE